MDVVLDLHRLAVLHDLEILDTPPELAYDDIATLAATSTSSTIAAVNFVDGDRHWTKAAVGAEPSHDTSVSADVSFCATTVRCDEDLLCIPDMAASERWRDHPLVTGPPGVRFYAGAKIIVSHQPVGVVCIYGDEPREISRRDERALLALARQVAAQLELRRRDRRMLEPALIDPLTGVANRRLLLDRLESAIAERRRRGGEIGVVICSCADAPRERAEVADRLLGAIAEELRHATGEADTVARSAPDEFTVVVPGLGSPVELDPVLARIRGALSCLRPLAEAPGGPGLAMRETFVRDGESAASVLKRA